MKLMQMLTTEQSAGAFVSVTEASNTGCTGCLAHWSSTPGWRQSTCLGARAGSEGGSACCIQGWGLLPCPPSQLVCRPHLLCWRDWYLALSSLSWEYLKSCPLDLAVMILQSSEPRERFCRCRPSPLHTQQSGCRSSNSRTSPCWAAAHWHEVNLILDIMLMLIWAESFGPLKKKGI